MCLGIEEEHPELARCVGARTVDAGTEAELVVQLEHEVGDGRIPYELIMSESVQGGVQVVVGAEAIGVVLVAGIAEKELVGLRKGSMSK